MKGAAAGILLFWGIFAGVMSVYLLTLCPSIYWGDSAEFVTVVHTLGVPHPTGYPLYCIFGKIFDLLPFGNPASRLNLFSALAASLGVAVVFLIVRASLLSAPELSSRSLAMAFWAAACLAFTQLYWSQAIIAEVYSLSALLIALLILVSFRNWHVPQRSYEIAFGLLAGLCLTHHAQSVFVIMPLGLLMIWRMGFSTGYMRRWLAMGVCAIVPLGLYLYLPLRSRANPPIDWGNPETLANFLWMISGGQFKMFLWKGLTGSSSLLAYWSRMTTFYATQFWSQWHLLSLLIPFGIRRLWKHDRAPCFALVVAWVALVFHALNYQVGDLEVYFLPTYLIAVVFMAHGLFDILEWLGQRASPSYTKALNAAVLCIPLAFLTANLPYVSLSGFRAAEDYGVSVFEQVQAPAVIITHSDNDIYPLWYQKYVCGLGQDVAVVGANFLSSPWYEPMLLREGIQTTLPSEIYQSRQEWMQAIWRKIISPTKASHRIYSTRPLEYNQLDCFMSPAAIPGFTWSPLFLLHLRSAPFPLRQVPVKVDYSNVSERYLQYLPLPFLFQMDQVLMELDGYRRVDFGVWTPMEAQR